MKRKYTFRSLVNDLHLWIGVPSALILFVVCLSGTVYVFSKEITQWIDRDKYTLTTTQEPTASGNQGSPLAPLPIARLIDLVEKDRAGFKTTAIQIPASRMEAWTFSLSPKEIQDRKPGKENREGAKKNAGNKPENEKARIKNLWVNPYTGIILGDAQTSSSRFFNTVQQLHRWLLIKRETGKVITGVAAICFLVLEITGLLLWLPVKIRNWKKWNAWKPGFRIKTDAHAKRINFDLHKAFGFYSFLVVTIMAITGPVLAFDWYRDGFSKALGVTPSKTVPGKKTDKALPEMPDQVITPTLDQLVQKANTLYPYSGDMRINLPKDSSGSVNISKGRTGLVALAAVDRVTLNPQTGATLKIEPFSKKTTGEKIVSSVKAIHTGEIFGLYSKIVYFLACLIATSLPVTGVMVWINKRRKKARIASTQTVAAVQRDAVQRETATPDYRCS
ncbi:PepSY-associated TM helix domain-containing protein [Flavitalea flava]